MTSLFDGVAGMLSATFGAQITHTPSGGSAVSIEGVLRREPVNIPDEDGREILDLGPVLRVTSDLAATISRGDEIIGPDGTTYTVLNAQPDGSPAADAFVIIELEET